MHRSSPALKRGNSTLGLRRAPSPQARAVSPSLASAPSVQAKAALFSQRSNGHGRASSPIHGTGTEIKSVTNASAHSTVDGNTRPTIRSRAKNHWQQAISEARSSRKSQATRIAVKTQPTQNEEAERRREERRIEVIVVLLHVVNLYFPVGFQQFKLLACLWDTVWKPFPSNSSINRGLCYLSCFF